MRQKSEQQHQQPASLSAPPRPMALRAQMWLCACATDAAMGWRRRSTRRR